MILGTRNTMKRSIMMLAAPLLLLSGCEKVFGNPVTDPVAVSDIRVADVLFDAITIEWTEVSDGSRGVADYLVAVDTVPPQWPGSVAYAKLVQGVTVGAAKTITVDGLLRGRLYFIQVMTVRGRLDSVPVFGRPSVLLTATTPVEAVSAVEDLEITGVSATSVSLRWTQVDDGTGSPANYLLASGTPTINWATARASAQVISGNSVQPTREVTVEGLSPATTFQFQLVAVRGMPVDTTPLDPKSNIVSTTTEPAGVAVTPLFQDNFDSGARSSANGFTWASSGSRVSVTTQNPRSGSHALSFRYGPDSNSIDSSAEQRFNLGRDLTEMWIEYYLYVPSNWNHRDQSPGNNKFFAAWANDYSTVGDIQIIFEYEKNTDSTSAVRVLSMNGGANSAGTRFTHLVGKSMAGRWNRIRIHLKAATGVAANNGVIEIWRDNLLVYSLYTHALYFDAGRNFFRNGYILGWSNSGYASETVFHIDDVKFFNQNPGW